MMDIQVFHRYNNLADEGKVQQLCCPDCQQVYITRITDDNEPVLQCVWCNSKVQPGFGLYQQIQAVVKEHYID